MDEAPRKIRKFVMRLKKMDKNEKLLRLRKFATYLWPNVIPYASRRHAKHLPEGYCKVCEVREADVQHHIIQIQFGGPDVSWNRINICHFCHGDIHPWLRINREQSEMDRIFKATIG